jgi:serine/threonine-protein kinase
MTQLLSALEHAHAHGIVHRDLKPENVFVIREPNGAEVIQLVDFGLAKVAEGGESRRALTQFGQVFGTPAYMSPEQCMGRSDLDHRTDLYALGCILFHVLCGRPPFLSDAGAGPMIAAHLRDAPPDPRTVAGDASPDRTAPHRCTAHPRRVSPRSATAPRSSGNAPVHRRSPVAARSPLALAGRRPR